MWKKFDKLLEAMDQPYVLAKVHKAGADSAARKIYAGTTHVGQAKISSREIVTAVDSHGISIYNVSQGQTRRKNIR